MTADEKLARIRIKVERAKQHLSALRYAIDGFMRLRPYVIKTKEGPQTRQRVYYVESFTEIGPDIAAIAGDVLQNLRSALDHLAYSLVEVGVGAPPPNPQAISFPIADSATTYPGVRDGRVPGMRQAAIDAIDATKPYAGGNDTLWRLHKLNIIDKHRLLLTIRSMPKGLDIGGYVYRMFRRMFPKSAAAAAPPDAFSAFFTADGATFPLTAGYEFFRDSIENPPDPYMKFSFEISIGEPGLVEGEPLFTTLQHMADVVDQLISSFRAHLV